jgi:hypothetical protein
VNKLINQCINSASLNRTDKILNSTNDGLIGFTSPRTISYLGKFFKIANKLGLLDKSCLRIISDTMGLTKSDSYIYQRLEQIFEKFAKELDKNCGFNIKDEIAKCGNNESSWINLIDRIIKSKLYTDPLFITIYLKEIREFILNNFSKTGEAFNKLTELIRLKTKSLENEVG